VSVLARRLAVLEASSRKDPLIVWAVDSAGQQSKMTVKKLLQSETFAFVRVCAGGNLKDLDALLNAVYQQARREVRGET
jgi:uncharacterized protein YecT (DUF1311 family)